MKRYKEYILESYLRTSERLKDLLKDMNDNVSNHLLKLIDNDIKTRYNALDYLDDVNNKISFLPDSQFNNKLKTISDYKELITDNNQKVKIGTLVKDILKDNGVEVTDKEVENFVNVFKSSLNKEEKFKIVKGEDIRYWYLESRYYEEYGGTLWNSCMRHDRCQPFFTIYVENDNVSLVIMTKKDKLLARALLWDNIDEGDGKYLDRIYSTSDQYKTQMLLWADKNIKNLTKNHNKVDVVSVKLDNYDFKYYPYMDTFRYSDRDGLFYNEGYKNMEMSREAEWVYTSTSGDREVYEKEEDNDGMVYSDIHGYNIDEDDAWYSEYYSDYLDMSSDRVVWCEKDEEYYMIRDCTRLYDGEVVLDSEALKVQSGDGEIYVYSKGSEFYEWEGEYYYHDYFVRGIDGEKIPPNKAIKVVEILFEEVDYPKIVREFITLLFNDTDIVERKIADILQLDYDASDIKYIAINEYVENRFNYKNIRKCLDLLVEIKDQKIINDNQYEYINNQMIESLDKFII
jgi:hypothetical protein